MCGTSITLMPKSILTGLLHLRDAIIPPRPTELIVRRLTLEELIDIPRMLHGALPYHDERVRALVWEIKYYANRRALSLCGTLLAEAFMELAQESVERILLIPIPMHKARRRERGHNQTELLAKAALAETGNIFEYVPRALVRSKNTVPQQGLPQSKRRTNVTGSMVVPNKDLVRGRVCLVLDDVSTTGATFAEAERALKKAGAQSVLTVALANS